AVDVAACVLQGGGGDSRRHIPCPCAAHPVRDGEQRWLEDVCILVAEAPAAGIREPGRAADPHGCTCSSVSPTRIRSPTRASWARSSFLPFTNVPFVDPRSLTNAPSGRGSMRACRPD